jgi:transcriptional regulator with XRE-family HTH domain
MLATVQPRLDGKPAIPPDLDLDHVIIVRAPELPERFARLLAARDLRANDVSDLSHVSKNTLSKWKRGETTVRVANARSVAQALGVEVQELLGKPFLKGDAPAPRPDDPNAASPFETFARDVAAVERPWPAAPAPDLMELFRDATALVERMESAARTSQADNAASRQLDQLVSRARMLLRQGSTSP